jgi:hypothetical protein
MSAPFSPEYIAIMERLQRSRPSEIEQESGKDDAVKELLKIVAVNKQIITALEEQTLIVKKNTQL